MFGDRVKHNRQSFAATYDDRPLIPLRYRGHARSIGGILSYTATSLIPQVLLDCCSAAMNSFASCRLLRCNRPPMHRYVFQEAMADCRYFPGLHAYGANASDRTTKPQRGVS